MIISHKYKFIFVKTAKTAGTSLEVLLSPVCAENDIFTPFSVPEPDHDPRNYKGWFNPLPDIITKFKIRKEFGNQYLIRELGMISSQLAGRKKFFHHIPAWQIRNRVDSSIWNDYYKFSIERDPYEKVISGWKWFNFKFQKEITLDQYLDFLIKNSKIRDHGVGIYPYNYRNYTDPITHLVIVDKVINYNHLHEELSDIKKLLGIDMNLDKMPRSKTLTKTSGSKIPYVFSESQKEIIQNLFKNELE